MFNPTFWAVTQPLDLSIFLPSAGFHLTQHFLEQWFLNLSWGPPTTAYFVCLPHLTHLIQLISSLVESARLEMGVAYEGDIQNVWWLGVPRTGLRTTDLECTCL